MSAALTLYRALAPVAANLAPLAAPFSPKLRAGLQGRVGLAARIDAAAPRLQGCVWLHAASVGEFLQGIPLIDAVRRELGAATPPIAFTHFSPSGFAFAQRQPVADHHDYLPLDTPRAMAHLMAAWRPRLLVCVSFDVWPNLILAAQRAGVPAVLMSGSFPPRSARLLGPARALYRDLFDRFAHLGVATEHDRRRFVDGLGVRAPITVTGNTRIEQVIVRYEAARGGRVSQRLSALGGRLLVLGSTWPADERVWLPALPELLARHDDLRVVLCPHEPHPAHLDDLAAWCAAHRLPSLPLSTLLADPTATPRVVLVDSVGVLAEIYRAGACAYVGGGFTTGVHNTMEPAIAGLPVFFGPRHQNAEEAAVLVARGAGFVTRTAAEAADAVRPLLDDPALCRRTGEAARQVVLDQRGAAARSLEILRPWLPSPDQR